MSDRTSISELPTSIRQMLSAVRRRIRAYVWIEGVAIIIAAIGALFWLGLALDWFFEPSPAVRRIGLIIAAAIVLLVGYRYLLRRVFVRISDVTAALLLERHFPALADHLITAVDVASLPPHSIEFNPDLVEETNEAAKTAVAGINPRELFNRGPLVRSVITATALAVSLIAFALLSSNVFGFWLQRIALSDTPWPRRVQLKVVGFPADTTGRRVHKLAQDDDFELLVHANTNGYEVPSEVEIRYRLADGRRGRDTLTRVGDALANQGDYQLFRYEFKHIAGNMDFDVVGGDDRVRDLHLQVVDRPELAAIELECVYPEYLARPPHRLSVTGGMRIPEGTRITLHANATKPLIAANVHATKHKKETAISITSNDSQQLDYDYGTLTADDVLLVSVTDIDGVSSREPYRISLSFVPDEVPQVAVRLAGISTAITPDATLPLTGKVTDDYIVDRIWYEFQTDGGPTGKLSLPQTPTGLSTIDKFNPFDPHTVDPVTGKRVLELKPKQRLLLTLKAADRYNLDADKKPSKDALPHAGSSQQFLLDIVTPAQLLALLERRELALRQQFETIFEKMTDTRNLLARVGSDEAAPGTPEPGNQLEKPPNPHGDAATISADRLLSRSRLRISGSLQNVIQSVDETKGVAEAFDDLVQELTNNRIDNSDLKNRLGEQIAHPLHLISEKSMPQLVAQLKLAEEQIETPGASANELKKSIALADQLLVEMRHVLDRMLELETYNEVVSLLRDIISDQDQINKRTKEQQKDRLRSLFEE